MSETKFKAFCVANGLTARMVAEKCGISRFTVLAYFQGKRTPNRKTMLILEEQYKEYGFNPYEIFFKK